MKMDMSVGQSPKLDFGMGSRSPHFEFGTEVVETNDYERLGNKPSIEGVELVGDKLLEEFGLRGGENVIVDHGLVEIDEMTAAQAAALLN